MAAYGLYTHIRANRRRSVILLIGLFFLVYVLVFAGALVAEVFIYGDAPLDYLLAAARYDFLKAAPFATIATLIWILIAYKFHQRMIDAMTDGHGVTREEEPELYNLLENLCISRGIPMPKLKIAEDTALNAFATGLNQKQYSITVTRGLMEALNRDELEAVLGHELTHIRNGDVRMLVIAVVIAGVISFFGELVFRMFFQGRYYGGGSRSSSSGDRKGGGAIIAILIAVALIVVAWILSIVIRFALSRRREFLADAGAVELTKNPDAMITALRKIENRGELQRAPSGRDGDVRRQSALGFHRPVRDASVGRGALQSDRGVRRRPRSGTATARSARRGRPDRRRNAAAIAGSKRRCAAAGRRPLERAAAAPLGPSVLGPAQLKVRLRTSSDAFALTRGRNTNRCERDFFRGRRRLVSSDRRRLFLLGFLRRLLGRLRSSSSPQPAALSLCARSFFSFFFSNLIRLSLLAMSSSH